MTGLTDRSRGKKWLRLTNRCIFRISLHPPNSVCQSTLLPMVVLQKNSRPPARSLHVCRRHYYYSYVFCNSCYYCNIEYDVLHPLQSFRLRYASLQRVYYRSSATYVSPVRQVWLCWVPVKNLLWIHYVPLEYRKVALISSSTGKFIKSTCCGSFLYRNFVPNILKSLPSNLQQRMRYS